MSERVKCRHTILLAISFGAFAPAPSVAAPPGSTPALQLTPCKVADIAEEVRCGTFLVPEDRLRPDGRTLSLKVVVIRAKEPRGSSEPVFLFEGGPGDAATESASYVRDNWVSREKDVVLIDQRGTGEGHKLTCKLAGSDENIPGYIESRGAALAACGAKLSKEVDVTKYVTPVAIQDVDEIRRALGYDKINVHGGSYGGRAAMAYARYYPQAVRAAYLVAPAPLELKLPLYFAWSAQRAVDAKLAECAKEADCRARYPDPEGDLEAIVRQLDKGPIEVVVDHPKTGLPIKVSLTKWGFGYGLLGDLYVAKEPSQLADMLHRARSGDFKAIVEGWIKRARERRPSTDFPWGMHRTIVCNEDVSQWPADPVAETLGTFFGGELIKEAQLACSTWPKAAFPADYFAPYQSNVPTLIVSGQFDPVAPPRWSEAARKTHPNSIHIVTQFGHSFREEGCLDAISSEFMREASVKNLDLRCIAESGGDLELMGDGN